MASDEMRKKWGTIFMGDREASVEQLKAMREKADHEKLQKERTEDYMERVRARAADRAREILGEAYTERQKVLDETKGEVAVQKRLAAQECARIKAEGENLRSQAQEELDKAREELAEAARIREGAHDEGYRAGMDQAGAELQEFRAELGQSMGVLMRGIERQRKNILENWRNELTALTLAAVEAGTGMILQKENQAILKSLVHKSLDMLESRSAIACRVNPRDEETVSDLFRAAREKYPELRQWTVSGDESIEPGGLVVESGSGSVDLKRENFREMVSGILEHLGLPEHEQEEREAQEMAHLVEKEIAHIASLSPEPDKPETTVVEEMQPEEEMHAPVEEPVEIKEDEPILMEEEIPEETGEEEPQNMVMEEPVAADQTLAELEEELFPLEGEELETASEVSEEKAEPKSGVDSKILTEGGFL